MDLLKMKIKESGLKLNAIAKKLNLSPNGLYRKLRGESPFMANEIRDLKKILCLTNSETEEIFYR